jgi:hypothetical protein
MGLAPSMFFEFHQRQLDVQEKIGRDPAQKTANK